MFQANPEDLHKGDFVHILAEDGSVSVAVEFGGIVGRGKKGFFKLLQIETDRYVLVPKTTRFVWGSNGPDCYNPYYQWNVLPYFYDE